jgi:nucleotide-binding universal stress UspA family protein
MEIAVCEGYPARQILNFHERKAHDLIIMGGRRQGNFVRRLDHGAAEAVIAEARCPVLMLGGAIESVSASIESDSQLSLA